MYTPLVAQATKVSIRRKCTKYFQENPCVAANTMTFYDLLNIQ